MKTDRGLMVTGDPRTDKRVVDSAPKYYIASPRAKNNIYSVIECASERRPPRGGGRVGVVVPRG